MSPRSHRATPFRKGEPHARELDATLLLRCDLTEVAGVAKNIHPLIFQTQTQISRFCAGRGYAKAKRAEFLPIAGTFSSLSPCEGMWPRQLATGPFHV